MQKELRIEQIVEDERYQIINYKTDPPTYGIRDKFAKAELKIDPVINTVRGVFHACNWYIRITTMPQDLYNAKLKVYVNNMQRNQAAIDTTRESPVSTVRKSPAATVCESAASDDDWATVKCKICARHVACSLFEKHEINHKNAKHQCDVCWKLFGQTKDLKVHMRIHTGEKPFKCCKCQKCFSQSGNLERHLLMHKGKRPYKCKECRRCFTQNGNLKQHMLIHSGKRPYHCRLCDYTFTRNAHLKRHLKVHALK